MKYFLYISLIVFLSLNTCERNLVATKQTYQDLLNHFANQRNYREIIRHCNHFIENPNPEAITKILYFLQQQNKSLIHLIKAAWEERRSDFLQRAQQQIPNLTELQTYDTISDPLQKKYYLVLISFKTFEIWINSQK